MEKKRVRDTIKDCIKTQRIKELLSVAVPIVSSFIVASDTSS